MLIPLIGSGDVPDPEPKETAIEAARRREELVHRVASSSTFEKSPRLRAFFLHVCRCALENKPEEATEQQIGIHVYDRPPGYNPNEDNVVRTAARQLRMKLEHHFATEGKDEPVVITIPKGRYLPLFEGRSESSSVAPGGVPVAGVRKGTSRRLALIAVFVLFGVAAFVFLYHQRRSRTPQGALQPSTVSGGDQDGSDATDVAMLGPGKSEVRIAAGSSAPFLDARGQRWEADRYYEGGVSRTGPRHLFPPVADAGLFRTIREATSTNPMAPQLFRYDIPLDPGVYELRLYFADPLRQPEEDNKEDAQNLRHFRVSLNGRRVLMGFDPVADAGSAAVSVRAFKDVTPAADGKLHLEFSGGQPFVSAIELTPGRPGKLSPIRIAAQGSDFVDTDGTHWNQDSYFIGGRTLVYSNPEPGPKVPPLYTAERFGNFSYAIPVPAGSYTVRLHFLESFFSPAIPLAYCHGPGCRVFDVTCNGNTLLQDFDIVREAQGPFRPLVREFRGLRPNGQGKLLLSFSPKVNYAEVRAIEVIDEAK